MLDERVLELQGHPVARTINREAEIFAAVYDRLDGEIAAEKQRTAGSAAACAVEGSGGTRKGDEAARSVRRFGPTWPPSGRVAPYRGATRVVQVKKTECPRADAPVCSCHDRLAVVIEPRIRREVPRWTTAAARRILVRDIGTPHRATGPRGARRSDDAAERTAGTPPISSGLACPTVS
jgi:hypothetical protein